MDDVLNNEYVVLDDDLSKLSSGYSSPIVDYGAAYFALNSAFVNLKLRLQSAEARNNLFEKWLQKKNDWNPLRTVDGVVTSSPETADSVTPGVTDHQSDLEAIRNGFHLLQFENERLRKVIAKQKRLSSFYLDRNKELSNEVQKLQKSPLEFKESPNSLLDIDPPLNTCSKCDMLMETLQQERIQHRFAIDEHLEKEIKKDEDWRELLSRFEQKEIQLEFERKIHKEQLDDLKRKEVSQTQEHNRLLEDYTQISNKFQLVMKKNLELKSELRQKDMQFKRKWKSPLLSSSHDELSYLRTYSVNLSDQTTPEISEINSVLSQLDGIVAQQHLMLKKCRVLPLHPIDLPPHTARSQSLGCIEFYRPEDDISPSDPFDLDLNLNTMEEEEDCVNSEDQRKSTSSALGEEDSQPKQMADAHSDSSELLLDFNENHPSISETVNAPFQEFDPLLQENQTSSADEPRKCPMCFQQLSCPTNDFEKHVYQHFES